MSSSDSPNLGATPIADSIAPPNAEMDREALRALNGQMPDSLWDWEVGPQREWYSSRFMALLNANTEPIDANAPLLSTLTNLAHPDDQDSIEQIARHAHEATAFDVQIRIRTMRDSYRWYRVRGAGLMNAQGQQLLSAGVLADIQHEKLLERDNHAYQAALEQRNEVLDEYARAASHDLRAPLHSIAQLATWISEDSKDLLPESSHRHLILLKDRAQRMIALVSGMLEYASSGVNDGQVESIDIEAMLGNVMSLVVPPNGPTVTMKVQCESISAHQIPLQQCISNLVDNALKHCATDKPEVSVTVERTAGFVKFSVRDNGQGIAKEYQERIFSMFETLRPRDQVEGSGIGLAIVRKVCKQYGGDIAVQSTPHQGAEFVLSWPDNTNQPSEDNLD